MKMSSGPEKAISSDSVSAVNDEEKRQQYVPDGGPEKTRGVARIEVVKDYMSKTYFYIFAGSIFLTAWMATLDSSTTYNYQPYATSSFNRHSMLSTLTIATSVIGAVAKPFIAKISDVTSRPITYVLVLVLYVMGFIIVACSPTIAAYVIGSVFIAIGQSGVSLLNSVVVADMTTLKWRSFVTSLLDIPYLVTTWVSGYIVDQIVDSNWRWGYGMFAIITPAALVPAISVMFWLDHQANKQGMVPYGADPFHQKKEQVQRSNAATFKAYLVLFKEAMIEIDAFGLVLLGFAFTLLLLPFSLYSYADGGWKNPSMIAMVVVGAVFLLIYVIFEIWIAPFPSLPKRTLTNRTFICCVIIDFIYQMAGYFATLYFTSYTYAVFDLNKQDWVYFSNTLTMGLVFFGVFWGVVFRIFRRYKVFQVTGIAVKLIGMGLYVRASSTTAPPKMSWLIAGLIIETFGDAASVMGTQVAAQAAVPHQDMASTMSVLSLYSSIGAAVGSAITAAIWSSKLKHALRKYVSSAYLADSMFEDVTVIHSTPWGSAPRLGAIKAYQEVNHTLFIMAVSVSSLMLIGAVFQTNFYLGDQQNCVEGQQNEDYHHKEDGSKLTLLDRIADFFNKPLY